MIDAVLSRDVAFSAGGDLKEMADMGLEVPPRDFIPRLGYNIHTDKPVITAVGVRSMAYASGMLMIEVDVDLAGDPMLKHM
jgi:enoyl-CoA hydratase/carnithine racemase